MKVSQLYTYPIKSLRGCTAPTFHPTYRGFLHDRVFMLLRASDLKNMHVSHFPEMCLFTTSISFPSDPSDKHGGTITVEHHAPNATSEKPPSLEVPLQPKWEGLEEVKVVMHGSPTIGFNMGPQYNDWFSSCFGYDVILAYLGPNRREILGNMPPSAAMRSQGSINNKNKSWMSTITSSIPSILGGGAAWGGVDEGITFADCAPYLVISEKSWANTQRRLPEGELMDISKFRPNIIVSGAEVDFEEDYWGELEFASASPGPASPLRIVLTQNCARCNSLNVDYKTGKVGEGEAGKILKKLQSDRRVDPGAKYSPIFGRYGFLGEGPEGRGINVGDEVKVVRRNEERSRFEWPNLST